MRGRRRGRTIRVRLRVRVRGGGRARTRGRGRWQARLRVVGLAAVVALLATFAVREALRPGPWQRVFATREGLVGRRMATGEVIHAGDLFVALPHPSALRRDVELRYGERIVIVPVMDVGPWNVDDAYWRNSDRPAAENGRGTFRKPVNPAGIDLSDATYAALGLRGNDYLEWRFVHRGYVSLPRLGTSAALARP
jgi:hypothetical protein